MIPLFDGHADTLSLCWKDSRTLAKNQGHIDLEKTANFAPYAQFFAVFANSANLTPDQCYAAFQGQYQTFLQMMDINANAIQFCCTGNEAERAFQQKKAVAFLSVEGAELLRCDLDCLAKAHAMGVRAINLTWNNPNILSGSCWSECDRGLSQQGVAFVEEMQRLGMLVDVSHLSEPGFWDVMATAKKPIFASHSNAKSVFFHERNLTDEQFTAIIKNGGVAGLNFYAQFLGNQANVDTIIAHIEHFLALGGTQNVAMGGDWDGNDELPQGFATIADIDVLWQRMGQLNYPDALIEAIFFTNMMRVVNEVCTI